MDSEFKSYLLVKISAPHHEWYNPDGNSSCAVVTRVLREGWVRAFLWECKEVGNDLKRFFAEDFSGLETPISWFIALIFIPVFLLITPFTRTKSRYDAAIKDYLVEYNRQRKKNGPTGI